MPAQKKTDKTDLVGPLGKPKTEAGRDAMYPFPGGYLEEKQYEVHLRQLLVDQGAAYALGNDERLYTWNREMAVWIIAR